MVTDKLVYQEILACLSKKYGKITEKENSVGATNNKDTIQTETPLEKLDDMSLEEWQRQLLVRYQELQDVIKKSAMPLYNLWIKTELHKKQEQEAAANQDNAFLAETR